jgi:hypothetical protein
MVISATLIQVEKVEAVGLHLQQLRGDGGGGGINYIHGN